MDDPIVAGLSIVRTDCTWSSKKPEEIVCQLFIEGLGGGVTMFPTTVLLRGDCPVSLGVLHQESADDFVVVVEHWMEENNHPEFANLQFAGLLEE
jgi:hypothetical protein